MLTANQRMAVLLVASTDERLYTNAQREYFAQLLEQALKESERATAQSANHGKISQA